jgi:hypothetical protein
VRVEKEIKEGRKRRNRCGLYMQSTAGAQSEVHGSRCVDDGGDPVSAPITCTSLTIYALRCMSIASSRTFICGSNRSYMHQI